MMQCPMCGRENPEGTRYCPQCGQNLSVAPDTSVAGVRADADRDMVSNLVPLAGVAGSPIATMVTTADRFENYRVVGYLGIVRGLTVRSRSVVGNIAGQLQSLLGGSIGAYVELCEHARAEAFELMVQHAAQLGATAVIAMRYDANDVLDGITEVLAYGTAVILEPIESIDSGVQPSR